MLAAHRVRLSACNRHAPESLPQALLLRSPVNMQLPWSEWDGAENPGLLSFFLKYFHHSFKKIYEVLTGSAKQG